MLALLTGTNNTSIGNQSLINVTGNENVGVGKRSGDVVTSGSNNTFIGTNANATAGNGTQVNSTAIGSGAIVSASNTIQLGNTAITNVKTSGTLTAGTVTYPKAHGTSGQVLSTTGSGALTWSTPSTTATSYSGILPVANGGTGSATQNFVDLTTNQTIAGNKTFAGDLKVGTYMTLGKGGGNNTYNTAFGESALSQNTTGRLNTSIGFETQKINITGEQNTALGAYALKENTASYNTASGSYALQLNTTGQYNVAFGRESLKANTTGSKNTAIGHNANVSLNNLENATAIGYNAQVTNSNTIQLGNTNITNVKTSGTITAGTITIPNTDGTNGQVLKTNGSGVLAWSTPSVADSSTFVDLTTAQTIAGTKTFSSDASINGINIGRGGGNFNTNSAIGLQALAANTSGQYNTATGLQALSRVSTSNSNSAYGYRALAIHLGSSSSAFGMKALEGNTTGNYNTAVGEAALKSNTTASNNTAVGQQSLWSNITGAGNTALGRLALKNNLNNNNTAVGLSALVTNTTGYENTALGSQADVTVANITNATAIGFKAKVANTNTIQLGNTAVTDVKTSGKLTTGTVTYPNIHNATAGQVLTTNASGVATWANLAPATSYSGVLPVANGGTGSATQNFVDVTTAQTIAGTKTFNSDIMISTLTIGKGSGGDYTSVAIGTDALDVNTTGTRNTAIGTYALLNTTGGNNTANGYYALQTNTTGSNNTSIGSFSGPDVGNLVNSTAIGFEARVTNSNTIQLGNTAVTEVRTSGLVKGKAFHATGPNYTGLEGGYLVWNLLQPGSSNFRDGYTSFVNNKGEGAGGFRFYNVSTTVEPSIAPIVEINASGAVTANGFMKSGGTASQFLMADGSVSTGAVAVREVADEFTAILDQTSFTLTQTPSENSMVKMYVNGIRISNSAYSWDGATLTYTPASNGGYSITAGDRIQFDFYY